MISMRVEKQLITIGFSHPVFCISYIPYPTLRMETGGEACIIS